MEKIIKSAFVVFLCLSGLFANSQTGQNKGAAVFGKPIKIPGKEAQCATVEYESYLHMKNPNYSKENFEKWLAPKVVDAKKKLTQKNGTQVITLPVVVHIIHSGEQIGEGKNLSDEQVLSQITVLNQDYRREEDTPGFNENPVGADVEIEFCLAKRDPAGNPTTGITRTELSTESWQLENIEMDLKPQTQWDPERYINIWVCSIAIQEDDMHLLGYAFFPSDTDIEGLDGFEGLPETSDGIVIDYAVFGSLDIYPQSNLLSGYSGGRTATHEMGHFLGLRHIWGDENDCTGTDYCDDTPATLEANRECVLINSCPSPGADMIENYMDYTPDTCQNVFTIDQKARIMAVLENSQHRSSLLMSDACTPSSLGLNENNQIPGLFIYPNPTNEVLHIVSETANGKGSYAIYNTIGQVVAAGETLFEKDITIDTSLLSPGMYIIKIAVEGKAKTDRFIKE